MWLRRGCFVFNTFFLKYSFVLLFLLIYKEDIQLFELISCHWYRSIPPENIQKIRLFLKFSGGMEKSVIRILVQEKAISFHKINMETLQHPFTGFSFVYYFF